MTFKMITGNVRILYIIKMPDYMKIIELFEIEMINYIIWRIKFQIYNESVHIGEISMKHH